MKDRHQTRRIRPCAQGTRRRTRRGGARTLNNASTKNTPKNDSKRYLGATRKEVLTKVVGGETFEITVYYSPSADMPADAQREIKAFFTGNRLDITNANIEENLRNLNWDAVVNVRNVGKPDRTVGTFQWAKWCPKTASSKLWVHDVSRIYTAKGAVSPTKVLFDFAKEKGREKKLPFVYLMVDEVDKEGAAAGSTSVWKILTEIYSKAEYGFSVHASGCRIGDHTYTSMRAHV